jgi:hypothetical protein
MNCTLKGRRSTIQGTGTRVLDDLLVPVQNCVVPFLGLSSAQYCTVWVLRQEFQAKQHGPEHGGLGMGLLSFHESNWSIPTRRTLTNTRTQDLNRCKIWGSHSGAADVTSLLERYVMLIGKLVKEAPKDCRVRHSQQGRLDPPWRWRQVRFDIMAADKLMQSEVCMYWPIFTKHC